MDLWNDYTMNAEWGLDLLAQPNGPFGDLDELNRLYGDTDPAHKPGDAVKQQDVSSTTPISDESLFGLEWMESTDVGSFLDALDAPEVPLGRSNLFDCSQKFSIEDNFLSQDLTSPQSSSSNFECEIQQGLTPPISPGETFGFVAIEPELIQKTSPILDVITPELSPNGQSSGYLLEEQLDTATPLFGSDYLEFSLGVEVETEFPIQSESIIEVTEAIPFSIDGFGDNENFVSSSVPSPKPSIESVIQASPELYKVIATPSNVSARYAPYTKEKAQKSRSKVAKSGKAKVEIPVECSSSNQQLGKRERKKIQNKNAAIRYRQKKKMEVQVISSEVQDLEDKNESLKTKVSDLEREVGYMKSLMEDIFKAKGLIKT